MPAREVAEDERRRDVQHRLRHRGRRRRGPQEAPGPPQAPAEAGGHRGPAQGRGGAGGGRGGRPGCRGRVGRLVRPPRDPARRRPRPPTGLGGGFTIHHYLVSQYPMTTKTISAKDVAELRARTGAGMMDCKKALEEAGGDMDKAGEMLRTQGHRQGREAGRAERVARASWSTTCTTTARSACMVELNSETDFVARTEDFGQLARDIALHIASADPIGVNPEDIPAELLERERRIAEEQVAAEGKPETIRAKIVEGKLKKFVAERTLLEQPFVKDDSKTVGQLVKEVSGKLGEAVVVRRFARFKIGEA